MHVYEFKKCVEHWRLDLGIEQPREIVSIDVTDDNGRVIPTDFRVECDDYSYHFDDAIAVGRHAPDRDDAGLCGCMKGLRPRHELIVVFKLPGNHPNLKLHITWKEIEGPPAHKRWFKRSGAVELLPFRPVDVISNSEHEVAASGSSWSVRATPFDDGHWYFSAVL